MSRPTHVCFVFGHLTRAELSSGGDILAADVAAAWRRDYSDVRVSVIVPEFARDTFEGIVGPENVLAFEEPAPDLDKLFARPWNLVRLFHGRIAPISRVLDRYLPDVVYTTGDFFVNHAAARRYRRRRPNAYWLAAVYHINPPPLRRHNGFLASAASFALQRLSLSWLAADGDLVLVLNDGVRRDLAKLGIGADRVRVTGGAIRLDEFPLGPPAEPGKRILWLNRLHPTKGLDDLPRIWSLVPTDVTLDVIGASPSHHEFLAAARQYGVDSRLRLHGFVTKERRWQLMQQANAFISCSYEEGWGISICEALAMGLPVVAYDLPALREVFGELISLVPVGDVQAFASAITHTLNSDRRELHAARRQAVAKHDIAHLARRQAEVLFARWNERRRVTIVGVGAVGEAGEDDRTPAVAARFAADGVEHAVICSPLAANAVRRVSRSSHMILVGSNRTLRSRAAIAREYFRRVAKLTTVPIPCSTVVYAITGEVIDVAAALIVARRAKARLVIALDPQERDERRASPGYRLYALAVRFVTRQLYRLSDLIVSSDPAAGSELAARHLRVVSTVTYTEEARAVAAFVGGAGAPAIVGDGHDN
jgi:glycosyltransferase involved in cell wall biosynthesis